MNQALTEIPEQGLNVGQYKKQILIKVFSEKADAIERMTKPILKGLRYDSIEGRTVITLVLQDE